MIDLHNFLAINGFDFENKVNNAGSFTQIKLYGQPIMRFGDNKYFYAKHIKDALDEFEMDYAECPEGFPDLNGTDYSVEGMGLARKLENKKILLTGANCNKRHAKAISELTGEEFVFGW